MSNLSTRLLKGSVWISASRGLVNGLGMISTIVLARLLLPADFGLVALGTTMLAILQAVTELSLSQALMHHREPTDDHFHAAWTLGMTRGVVLGGLFAAAGPMAANFYGDERLTSIMYALGFSVVLSGLANPRRIMLQKQLIFWQDFVLSVSQKLIGVVVSIVVALVYHSYWALIAGTIAGQVAQVMISYTVLPFRPKIGFRHAKELWSFSIWLSLSQITTTIIWRFDQLLIGKFLGAAPLGYYTVGSNLSMLPTREATLPLTQTLFPAFARLRDDHDRLRRAYQRAQGLVTAIALPLGVGMALVADPLVLVTMGEKWLPVTIVIKALATVFAIQTIGTLVQPLGMALGVTRLLFIRDTQFFFLRLPLISAGIYFDGLQGAVYARIITGLVAVFINLFLIKKLIALPIFVQLKANLRSMTAVAIMSAGVYGLQMVWSAGETTTELLSYITVLVAVGAGCYIASTVVLWLLAGKPNGPEEEILALWRKASSKFLRR